ncbi:DUF3168 domain-containing protein [Cognatishimia sp. 1_MG-2023]|uniref:DUF3168 domain-containing protein n=1 Tax=Cognatishimia sp. 1_MG-2023 TaxID=3062642 RepID=UPI0026E2E8B8|nr:DUF3168 domain-containing protein [Cognatishimia sp. 1_MG-2023]MDO6727232.1 DUF3168 domain-containing protein [Cognatishimia sp. 1_MG-2023]
MSYGVAVALQTAVYQQLVDDVPLDALIGDAVYDELPSGVIPATYVTLGPETVVDRSDKSGGGAVHRFVVSVVSDVAGFATPKAVAVAVSDALHNADLGLARGQLVSLVFERATATREDAANLRRIDLRFAARVDDQ